MTRYFQYFLVFFFSLFLLASSNQNQHLNTDSISQDPFENADLIQMFTIFKIMDDISSEIFKSFEGFEKRNRRKLYYLHRKKKHPNNIKKL
jgi:hypothetical protein